MDISQHLTTKSSKKPDFTTSRALARMAASQAVNTDFQTTQQDIFKMHHCVDEGCKNEGHCCWVLRSANTHHIIDKTHQEIWADQIINKVPLVTLQLPPQEWIVKFRKGWFLAPRKKTKGPRKNDQLASDSTPKVDQLPASAQPVHVHVTTAAPAVAPPQSSQQGPQIGPQMGYQPYGHYSQYKQYPSYGHSQYGHGYHQGHQGYGTGPNYNYGVFSDPPNPRRNGTLYQQSRGPPASSHGT